MSDLVHLMAALGTGFTTGVIFFGGLWLTIRSVLATDRGPGSVGSPLEESRMVPGRGQFSRETPPPHDVPLRRMTGGPSAGNPRAGCISLRPRRNSTAEGQGSFPGRLPPHGGPTLLVASFWARQILTVAAVGMVCQGSIAAWAAAMTGWLGAKLLIVGLVAGTEVAAWE